MEETARSRLPLLPALLLLLAAIGGGVVGGLIVYMVDDDAPSTAPVSTERQPALSAEDADITAVVREASPAVVTIINRMEPRQTELGTLVEETSVGSGVIVDEDGYIVTNEHVIRDAQELTVQLVSGEERAGRVVAADDPFTDLAVIKVQAGGLTALSWGDSDALQLGERVIAIGSALNEFQGSVTTGVVSGLHRTWLREGVMMEDLVQTDAAINHGNSGGALLNDRGELVGLNSTVIRSTDGGDIVEGIAFAISSKTAVPIVEAIVRDGVYPRAFLGIVHQDIDEGMQGFDLASDRGALVLRVSSGTPAAEAGLREGDIILKMGGIDLTPEMPFINALGTLPPDGPQEFEVLRGDEQLTLQVNLVARER